MFHAFLSSCGLVAISEMGDKTQLLAFSLAARFRKPVPILLGILAATLLNHALAASIGAWVASFFPERTLLLVLAAIFVGFGLWTLKPDTFEESESKKMYGPFLTTLVLFFLAEMGDKTQLATVALAARFHSVVVVTAGTTLGMMLTDGLAVFLGDRLSHRVQLKWVRVFAASLFVIFGLLAAFQALK